MTILIIAFGILMLLAGISIILNPVNLFEFLKTRTEKLYLYILAIVARLLLGALLIHLADISKFPFLIEIIGWISIVAAVIFIIIGHNNFVRLMSWVLSKAKPFGHIGGILAVCFGTFIIYAFI